MKSRALLCVAFLLAGSAAYGQVISASVNGAVLDPAGAAVPNAKVRAKNTATNLEITTQTDGDGRYTFPSLPPGGPYSVTVSAPGFNTEEHSGITLEVTQAARIDFSLKIGAATETVQVTAEAPLVDSTTAAMGQVVSGESIVNLPLNQRNTYSLVFLTPGVQGDVSFTYNNMNFSVNGGRPGTTDILVDGIPLSPGLANPNQGIAVFPSVESVEEFKVQTNSYSAEFGRSGSGIINLIYKSGTNNLHGSLFEFLRNSDLDANNYFSNLAGVGLPNFKRNQFGASAGGPVALPRLYNGRNKTFFFVAYEGLRQGSATTMTTTVPTAAQRAGDFSKTLNAAGQLVTIYDPTTTVAQGSGFVRNKSLEETKPHGLRVKSTKSGHTRRFAIPASVIDVLREHKREQDQQRALYGPDYANLNLIFARPDGNYYSPDKLGTRVRAAMARAGLKGVSLHSLRHSHASELLSKGAPITAVSERLGHASPNITLGIYSHALPADNEAAAKLWNDAMADVIAESRKEAAKNRMLSNVITGGRKKSVTHIESAS
jgi:hypothetical protein